MTNTKIFVINDWENKNYNNKKCGKGLTFVAFLCILHSVEQCSSWHSAVSVDRKFYTQCKINTQR